MVLMMRSFGVATEAELDAFEANYGIKLPSDYSAFLKEHATRADEMNTRQNNWAINLALF